MKKYIFAIFSVCAALLFAGCSENLEFEDVLPVEKHYGEEVKFGGSASYNVKGGTKNGTRTVYGGYENITNGKEPVYWVSDDKVRLYCPQAAVKTADYKVTATAQNRDGKVAETGLDKITAAGLQWANPEQPHTFYGVYPIPEDESLKEGTILTGTIPSVQDYKSYRKETIDGKVSHVYEPDMNYAYMVARTEVANPNNIGENVYLKFLPIATAVEVEMVNTSNQNYSFREVHFSSDKPMAGSFTANLSGMNLGTGQNGVQYGDAIPNNISVADTKKTAGLRLYTSQSEVLTLEKDHSIKFTIFMLPGNDDVENLKVTFIASDGAQLNGTFSGIKIQKSKKNYMHQVPLGKDQAMTYNQAEWLKYVGDDVVCNTLSIPGAGGAASGNIFGRTSNNVDNYLEQSLSINDLWNVGIRCFEFTVDKHSTDNGNLGDVDVYCNAQNTGLTLDTCINRVKNLLAAHPEEFAMVIITYQQASGFNMRGDEGAVAQTRNPAIFMSQLNTYWENLTMPNESVCKALYNQNLTLAEARGKLFCIARPTSSGEDNYATISMTTDKSWVGRSVRKMVSTTYANPLTLPIISNPHILAIHGWGALKDKWYARGFTECIYHRGNGWDTFRNLLDVEQCRTAMGYNPDRPGRPFDTSTNVNDEFVTLSSGSYYGKQFYTSTTDQTTDITLSPNFFYSTVTKDGVVSNQGAWVQEWARVSPETKTYTIETGKYVRWLESISEKKDHVSKTLDYSLSKEKGEVVYINSLCGYYITNDVPLSIYPNELTDYNIKKDDYEIMNGFLNYTTVIVAQPNVLSTQSNEAGMCGDIDAFATEINTYFKDLLDARIIDGRLSGSTGIVLMDRISNKGVGASIPAIIIANNFAPDVQVQEPSDIPTGGELGSDDIVSDKGYNGVVWTIESK